MFNIISSSHIFRTLYRQGFMLQAAVWFRGSEPDAEILQLQVQFLALVIFFFDNVLLQHF
jgi:hypothetical protein